MNPDLARPVVPQRLVVSSTSIFGGFHQWGYPLKIGWFMMDIHGPSIYSYGFFWGVPRFLETSIQ